MMETQHHQAVLSAARLGNPSSSYKLSHNIKGAHKECRAPELTSLAGLDVKREAVQCAATGTSRMAAAKSHARLQVCHMHEHVADASTPKGHRQCLWHAQIDLLLDHGASLYSSDGMKGAIESLIGSNPTPEPGPATLSTGQGVWEVCCMHLTGL